MPYSSATIFVKGDPELIWLFLLDKISHPSHYLASVEHSVVSDITNGEVLRVLQTADFQVREKIEINSQTGEIITYLVEHPRFSGTTLYRVIEDQQGVSLTLTLDWKDNWGELRDTDSSFQKMVEDTIQSVKQALEA